MSALVSAARRYLGVKFKHLGRTPRALDCIGLGWLSFKDCGQTLPIPRHYGREPFRDNLMQSLIEALGDPLPSHADLQPGDVATFRFRDEPHHLAIVGMSPYGELTLIHADSSPGLRKVVEHRLDDWWRERLVAAFRRPV